jgi:hypothetical protein
MVDYCELTDAEMTALMAVKDKGLIGFIYDKYAPAIYGLILQKIRYKPTADDMLCKSFFDFCEISSSSTFSFKSIFMRLHNIASGYIKKGSMLFLIPRNYNMLNSDTKNL